MHGDGGLRAPPQAQEAEQAVLGGVLLSPAALGRIGYLRPEDFYRAAHRAIFRALRDMEAAGLPIDVVTVGERLDALGLAEQVGDPGYLIELASTTPSAANIEAYAEIVREKATLRELIAAGAALVNRGFDPAGQPARDVAAAACQTLSQLAGERVARGTRTLRYIGQQWLDEMQRRADGACRGLLTPWSGFNRLTTGLHPGDLVVLAARPGMGKSAAALGIALAAAHQGHRALMFSLEMTGVALFSRAVAGEADVPLAFLREPDGAWPEADVYWSRITAAVSRLRELPLVLDESPGLGIEQVVARARREHLRQPLGLVVIDHMHIMALPGKTSEVVEYGEITRRAKVLAKDLGCPVLLLAQLNRGVEARQHKRPVMSDLRASGNIEQDADVIAFLYRDDYYARQEGRASGAPGMVELIVAKQREGDTGTAWLRDALARGRLDDHDGEPPRTEATAPRAGWGRR